MKFIKYISISLLVLVLTNCDLERFPHDSLSKDDFGTLSGVQLLSTGIYSNLSGGNDKLMLTYNIFSSDNFVKIPRMFSDEPGGFTTNVMDPLKNGSISWVVWKDCYKNINTCNNVIANNSFGDDAELDEAVAELYFLRAWNYYMMTTLHTRPFTQQDISNLGLPLRLQPGDMEPATRSTIEELYAQMISDLEVAAQYLKPVSNRTRASQDAANALLARIYNLMLQPTNPDQETAAQAIEYAEKVINSSKVSLETDAASFFGSDKVITSDDVSDWPSTVSHYFANAKSSNETIWMLIRNVNATVEVALDADLNLSSEGQYLPVSTDYFNLLNKYPTDLRNNLIDKSYIDDGNGNLIIKYADPVYDALSINCNKYSYQNDEDHLGSTVVFRATEMHMILAEVYAKQNNIGQALEHINYIRKRAGVEEFTEANWASNSYGITDILDLVLNEKRLEMIGESQRKSDVYRNKKDLVRMYGFDSDYYLEEYQGGTISRWDSKEIIIPIPYGQILQSPDMVQNPY